MLAEAPGWFTYELPAHLIGVALKGQYCGQKQKWLAVRFLGDDEEIAVGPRDGASALEMGAGCRCADGLHRR